MRKFILTVIAISLLGTLSFAGVAKESAKAGKFAGKESVKVVKFSGKKSGHFGKKAAKVGAKVLY